MGRLSTRFYGTGVLQILIIEKPPVPSSHSTYGTNFLEQNLVNVGFSERRQQIVVAMQCASDKYNFAGANTFTGGPLTSVEGPWYVKDPEFQVSSEQGSFRMKSTEVDGEL